MNRSHRRSRFPRPLRVALSVLAWAILISSLALAAVPLYGQLTGEFRLLPVLSGSMEPLMKRGDLAWVEPKPLEELAVGDVLVFNSPSRGSTPSRRTIHRVTEFVERAEIRPQDVKPGVVFIRTKGDNNEDPDPWIAAVESKTVYVLTRVVPGMGQPLLVTQQLPLRATALLAAAVLLAGFGISKLRSSRKDVQRPAPVASPGPRGEAGPAPKPTSGRSWAAAFSLGPLFRHEFPLPLPSGSAPVPLALAPATPAVRSPAYEQKQWRGAVSAGAIGALAVALAGISAAVTAYFVDTEATRETVNAGTVGIHLGNSTIPLVISDLLPGEQLERVAELRNTGSVALGSLQMEVTGGTDALLNPTNGLQISVQRCTSAWSTGTDAAGRPTASCAGTTTALVADRPILGRTTLDLSAMNVRTPGGSDYLRFVLRLPETSPSPISGAQPTAAISFRAAQRAGENR
ncbi:MAG TPA: signal peptidase I [Actinomycetota bacterium]|nr:signal peptidase I [Actinomycetota bacterium]